MTPSVLASLVAMISCTVAANLLLKRGAMAESASSSLLSSLLEPGIIFGFLFFGAAAVLYAWVLRTLPLNIAQSLAAAQFVSVIVASSLILSEPIPLVRWLGIAFIGIGILIVGLSVDGATG
ncbi:EamA family transporter [Bosea sp. TND4EK4]|uniref:EamA family transporter n=1 Tax=Bosea sp. TND4EK4 TaxID=1907408 RepID=UPI0009569F53|nr:EamA family transporter [Bosea sp. TND4EK4]SIR20246.1 EamA-like transporter family protein [Bosea sp. TND4EK4]